MRTPLLHTMSRSIVLSAALAAGLTACGSDDDSGATEEPSSTGEDAATQDDTGASAATSVGGADAAVSGEGTATLTMVDGTTYEFAMSICETSNTDEFVIPDSYELLGTTADGAFRFSLTRAGLDEDFISQVGALEGDFDDDGQNEKMLYTADLGVEPLSVDGAIVSGTFLMNAIGPTRPHGDQVGVILDARC